MTPNARVGSEIERNRTSFLELLRDVTVAANESSTIDQGAQIVIDQICSKTPWRVGHVYLESEAGDLLISTRIWHAGDARLTALQQASASLGRNEADLAHRVLHSRQPEFLLIDSAPGALFPLAALAKEAGLKAVAAFPIQVGKVILGVMEFFSFEAIEPDGEFLALMVHTGAQLGQVISRQRAAEDLYHAKQIAESANRAKTEFLAIMSHEIRTPMNAILGVADLLSETTLTPKQREFVRVFQGAGMKLLDLINSILDLAKVESGRFDLASVDFDLSTVLDKVLELMTPIANARGLQLKCEVAPDIHLAVIGDPDRLRQILINLIGNALKFSYQGTVSVRVERDPEYRFDAVRFSVTDTGIGISPENREMIFQSFTQVDSSTTRKYGGTGLGLPICKGLVELMGGRIWCTSEIGKGSTFAFSVPLSFQSGSRCLPPVNREKAEQPSASGASSSPLAEEGSYEPITVADNGSGVRILVAEDSEDNLFLIHNYLQGSGVTLDEVTNGKQAVESIKSKKYDLVLMDLQMPIMDGHASTRAIREWERQTQSPPVPILALTAHAFQDVAKSSEEAGCTGHLTKPINKKALLQAISLHVRTKVVFLPPKEIGDSESEESQGRTFDQGQAPEELPVEVRELVPAYLERRQQDVISLRTAVQAEDYRTLSTLGHQLKGSGAAYGFEGLSRYGARLEEAAATNDLEEASRQTALIVKCLARLSNSVSGEV